MEYKITIYWLQTCIKNGEKGMRTKRCVYKHEGIPPYEVLNRFVDKCDIDSFKISIWTTIDELKPYKILATDEEGYYHF